MLKLPPPIWALVYVLTAAVISWVARPPPRVPRDFASRDFVDSTCLSHCALPPRGHQGRTHFSNQSQAITSGPYQFTRNPMYLGRVILTIGIAIWVGAWPMFGAPVALFATANWAHIPFEEAKMRRQFGAAYDNYVAGVRRWI